MTDIIVAIGAAPSVNAIKPVGQRKPRLRWGSDWAGDIRLSDYVEIWPAHADRAAVEAAIDRAVEGGAVSVTILTAARWLSAPAAADSLAAIGRRRGVAVTVGHIDGGDPRRVALRQALTAE